jgi:hypothetical protein
VAGCNEQHVVASGDPAPPPGSGACRIEVGTSGSANPYREFLKITPKLHAVCPFQESAGRAILFVLEDRDGLCTKTGSGNLVFRQVRRSSLDALVREASACNDALAGNAEQGDSGEGATYVWTGFPKEPGIVWHPQPGSAAYDAGAVKELILFGGLPVYRYVFANGVFCFEVAEGGSSPAEMLAEVGYRLPGSVRERRVDPSTSSEVGPGCVIGTWR